MSKARHGDGVFVLILMKRILRLMIVSAFQFLIIRKEKKIVVNQKSLSLLTSWECAVQFLIYDQLENGRGVMERVG